MHKLLAVAHAFIRSWFFLYGKKLYRIHLNGRRRKKAIISTLPHQSAKVPFREEEEEEEEAEAIFGATRPLSRLGEDWPFCSK